MQGEHDCSICGEEDLRMVTMTPCGHWYCSPCMHSWLATSRTCPQCRTPVTVTDCATVTLKMPPLGPGSELVQRCVG